MFCSNFRYRRQLFEPCFNSWCPKCYKAYDELKFYINLAEDDEGLVWKRKHDGDEFLVARKCDNLFGPFQCDKCWFRNLTKRNPLLNSQADNRLLMFIRRANLDMFWSRSSGTVDASRRGIRRIIKESLLLGFEPSLEKMGPWPVEDQWGLGLALVTLKASLDPGKNAKTHTQYVTIRKLASSYTNHFEVSKKALDKTWVLKSERSNSFFTQCSTRSEFFKRFKEGLRSRMGRDVKGDVAMDYHIVHAILKHLEEEMFDDAASFERKRWIAMAGAYYTISFTLALRGNEALMLDLAELRKNINVGMDEDPAHVMIPLLGKFKGEDFKRHHFLLAPLKTDSGFQPRKWLEWLIGSRASQGIFRGPAFSNTEGFVLYQQPFNIELREQLEWAKEEHPSLFPEDLDLDRIRCSRSFRKGSTSRAQDLGLAESVIDANNRWRAYERSKGATPQLTLRDHYLQFV